MRESQFLQFSLTKNTVSSIDCSNSKSIIQKAAPDVVLLLGEKFASGSQVFHFRECSETFCVCFFVCFNMLKLSYKLEIKYMFLIYTLMMMVIQYLWQNCNLWQYCKYTQCQNNTKNRQHFDHISMPVYCVLFFLSQSYLILDYSIFQCLCLVPFFFQQLRTIVSS